MLGKSEWKSFGIALVTFIISFIVYLIYNNNKTNELHNFMLSSLFSKFVDSMRNQRLEKLSYSFYSDMKISVKLIIKLQITHTKSLHCYCAN